MWHRRGSTHEIANRSADRLCSDSVSPKSIVFFSAWLKPTELAESRNKGRAGEVQDSAKAIRHSYQPIRGGQCGASCTVAPRDDRNSRRPRRKPGVEDCLVVGRQ